MDQKIIPNGVVTIIVRYKTRLLLFYRFKNSNELVNWYEIVKIGKSVNLLGHVRIAYIFHVFQNPKFKMLSGIYSIVGTVLLVLSLENIISIRVPNLSYFWLQFKITWLYKAISTLIADTH